MRCFLGSPVALSAADKGRSFSPQLNRVLRRLNMFAFCLAANAQRGRAGEARAGIWAGSVITSSRLGRRRFTLSTAGDFIAWPSAPPSSRDASRPRTRTTRRSPAWRFRGRTAKPRAGRRAPWRARNAPRLACDAASRQPGASGLRGTGQARASGARPRARPGRPGPCGFVARDWIRARRRHADARLQCFRARASRYRSGRAILSWTAVAAVAP